jgi:hypothetical protein
MYNTMIDVTVMYCAVSDSLIILTWCVCHFSSFYFSASIWQCAHKLQMFMAKEKLNEFRENLMRWLDQRKKQQQQSQQQQQQSSSATQPTTATTSA